MEDSTQIVHQHTSEGSKQGNDSLDKVEQNVKPATVENLKTESLHKPSSRLDPLEEESEDETRSTNSSGKISDESDGNDDPVDFKVTLEYFSFRSILDMHSKFINKRILVPVPSV